MAKFQQHLITSHSQLPRITFFTGKWRVSYVILLLESQTQLHYVACTPRSLLLAPRPTSLVVNSVWPGSPRGKRLSRAWRSWKKAGGREESIEKSWVFWREVMIGHWKWEVTRGKLYGHYFPPSEKPITAHEICAHSHIITIFATRLPLWLPHIDLFIFHVLGFEEGLVGIIGFKVSGDSP